MILNYLKSLLAILIPFFVLLLTITILSYFDIMSTTISNYFKIIIPVISMMIGGFYLGKRSKEKGWLEGIKIGLIFLILLFIFSYLAFSKGMNLRTLIYYFILLISSMLGSMIGINKKKTTTTTA